MSMRFDYDFQKVFTTTKLLGVGTTTNAYSRGNMPEPLPDNLNSIWVAPNGSNSNAGTEALPVLTVANALTKMGGAKLTCHIFRNGYVGDLVFDETVTLAFLSTYNLQVEEGEIATIILDNKLTLAGENYINGIRFEIESTATSGIMLQDNSSGTNIEIAFCDFIGAGSGTNFAPIGMSFGNVTANAKVIVRNNYVYCFTGLSFVASSCEIYNNLFISNRGTYTGTIESLNSITINNNALNINRITNNYFVGFEFALSWFLWNNPIAPGHTTNFQSNMFLDNDYLFNSNLSTGHNNTVNLDHNLELSANFINLTTTATLPTTFIINITNAIDKDTVLMMVNESDFLSNSTVESSELQFEGKQTPDDSGKYFLDSPLIGIGQIDIGSLIYTISGKPWDASATSLQGMDVDPDGTLWNCDFSTDKIYNTQRNGIKISEISGSVFATSPQIRQVVVDHTDNTLWVAEDNTKKIYNINRSTGVEISSFAYSVFSGSETSVLGLGYDEYTDTLWIGGNITNTVFNTDKTGTLLSSFNFSVFDATESQVSGIGVDSDENLWMSGRTNDKLYKTTKTGTLLKSFLGTVYEASATNPQGIGIDKNGFVWVGDNNPDTMSFINADGIADISPFLEITELTSQSYNKNFDLDWPPKGISISDVFVNHVSQNDINGNAHVGYDTIRRLFNFNYGDGIHISNLVMKKLQDLMSDKGSKRFKLLGEGGNLFEPDDTSAGTFSNTDNSVDPSVLPIPLVDNNWRGLWITINSLDYYIESNDESKLYLVDKLGNDFPANGAVNFIISYILVNTPNAQFTKKQTDSTQFKEGGAWRENNSNSQSFDYTIEQVDFEEIEDSEENI